MIPGAFSGKTIGIVGGHGGMGRWFASFFRDMGLAVEVSDLDTAMSNEELVLKSDIVILSTPMAVAVSLARELGPLMTEEKLFVDFSSLKEEVVQAMVDFSSAGVLGVHPMFGQYTASMQGQNVILTPGRGDLWTDPFRCLFEDAGAVVSVMEAATHDRHMAFVQSVTHLITIATGAYMMQENMDPETACRVATPIFRLNVDFVGRLFALDLGLYEDLIARNPYAREVSGLFAKVLAETSGILLDDPSADKRQRMEDIKNFLGAFTGDALRETNEILNCRFMKKD
ncbi:prephenate dehydrogenase/chorismate mutase/prephenate dehydrogenase [Desulfobotulus alkaliphilus]|uniref:Prephenate dehydrogenase/chorismate mutase/prephenate dehydrogenase n=1 Tax=Desulfobotulus alkaliphilus TaxID=622671 RepID=A0A562RBJ1_9BACT|nr:prephenate dehydrogenase/arogenate dehydrogenase family protein [Desulfobotulus alkaliphilus]TWI65736.1 prephenate dehydrogenase/chorismate mutase/prephenate dehydrogenase [Desulfobotulus alkaliphilus]